MKLSFSQRNKQMLRATFVDQSKLKTDPNANHLHHALILYSFISSHLQLMIILMPKVKKNVALIDSRYRFMFPIPWNLLSL